MYYSWNTAAIAINFPLRWMFIASDNQRHSTFLDTSWRGISGNLKKKFPDASKDFNANSSLAYFFSDESAEMYFFAMPLGWFLSIISFKHVHIPAADHCIQDNYFYSTE